MTQADTGGAGVNGLTDWMDEAQTPPHRAVREYMDEVSRVLRYTLGAAPYEPCIWVSAWRCVEIRAFRQMVQLSDEAIVRCRMTPQAFARYIIVEMAGRWARWVMAGADESAEVLEG